MTVSTKPYLIRAIHEWCVDQGFTPYVVAHVDNQVRVPRGHASDGQIVLDISPDATYQFVISNEDISFQARFNGVAHSILIPITHVLAVYASENMHGMAFEPELSEVSESGEAMDSILMESPTADHDDDPPSSPPPGASGKRPHLKVIK